MNKCLDIAGAPARLADYFRQEHPIHEHPLAETYAPTTTDDDDDDELCKLGISYPIPNRTG